MENKTPAVDKLSKSSVKIDKAHSVRTIPGPFASGVGLVSVGIVICVLHLGQIVTTGYQRAAISRSLTKEIAKSDNLKRVANSKLLRTMPEGTSRHLEEIGAIFGLVQNGKSDRALETLRSKSFNQPALRAMVESKLAALAEQDRRIKEINSQEKGLRGSQDRVLKKYELLRKEFAASLGYVEEVADPQDQAQGNKPAEAQANSSPDAQAKQSDLSPDKVFERYDKGIFYGLPTLPGLPEIAQANGIQKYVKAENAKLVSEQLTSSKSQLYRQLMLIKQRSDDLIQEYEHSLGKAGGYDREHEGIIDSHAELKREVLDLTRRAASDAVRPKTTAWTATIYSEFRQLFYRVTRKTIPELKMVTPPSRKTV